MFPRAPPFFGVSFARAPFGSWLKGKRGKAEATFGASLRYTFSLLLTDGKMVGHSPKSWGHGPVLKGSWRL